MIWLAMSKMHSPKRSSPRFLAVLLLLTRVQHWTALNKRAIDFTAAWAFSPSRVRSPEGNNNYRTRRLLPSRSTQKGQRTAWQHIDSNLFSRNLCFCRPLSFFLDVFVTWTAAMDYTVGNLQFSSDRPILGIGCIDASRCNLNLQKSLERPTVSIFFLCQRKTQGEPIEDGEKTVRDAMADTHTQK
jgi:hypothetical protein